MPNVIQFGVNGDSYNVKDTGISQMVRYNGSPLPYLYKQNVYYYDGSEHALSGYDLYKVNLEPGDVVSVFCDDQTTFWGTLNYQYVLMVRHNNGNYYISTPSGNNYLGAITTSPYPMFTVVAASETEYCMFCIKREYVGKTRLLINRPYNEFKPSGSVKQINTVTKINQNNAVFTGKMYASNNNGYFVDFGSGIGIYALALKVKTGDEIVFDRTATGFNFYGTFNGSTHENINSSPFVAPSDGICYLFKNDADADLITFYPKNSIKIDYKNIVNKPGEASLPFDGKVIAFLGDSITERWQWEPYVLQTLGGYGVNCGIGSTALSGDSATAYWQDTRLDAVKAANPDILTIMGGANDLTMNPVIGDSGDLTTKNTDTFIGAYSYIIDNLLTWKPSLKIVIISTSWAHNDGADYSQTVTYGDFAEACMLVAKYYKLPYVNLYDESGYNKYTMNSSPYNIYSADHIHPNESGAKIIAAMVIQKMKEVFGVV